MILRPPRSTRTDTLFPYTTLFRSQRRDIVRHDAWKHRARLFGHMGEQGDVLAFQPTGNGRQFCGSCVKRGQMMQRKAFHGDPATTKKSNMIVCMMECARKSQSGVESRGTEGKDRRACSQGQGLRTHTQ